ncbi:MAG: hypothetical protein Q7R81_01775 [Candidatus Peregrinibacteria bacterium]|nr:hypothetical protein [Candidatus Peregrinibacteria bacterium]
MPSPSSLIGSAWEFYRSQPALNTVVFWLLFIPFTVMNFLTRLITPIPLEGPTSPWQGALQHTVPVVILLLLALAALGIVATWGIACILLVGKRMLKTRAGRSRTSFRAVRHQAAKYILPLVLTGILRGCFTFFWTLLLVIPGIIYSIRTSFYSIVVVCEGKAYRTALKRSKDAVKGYTWQVFFRLFALGILLYLPANLLASGVELIIQGVDARLLPIADIIGSGLTSLATMLFTLAVIPLYAWLREGEMMVEDE